MKERVTLKDIAKSLNISIGTVERAIHGKQDIKPETKELILEKINELNYRPNKFARSLSVKNKKKIAVIIPYNSFFWQRVKEGIDSAANEVGYYGTTVEVICINRMDSNIVLSHLKNFKKEHYNGVILVPIGLENLKEELNDYSKGMQTLAFLNDDIQDVKRQFYVGPDNILIGSLAGELTGKFTRGNGKCLLVTVVRTKSLEMPVECKQRLSGFQRVIYREYPEIKTDLLTYEINTNDEYSVIVKRLEIDREITSIYSIDGFLGEAALALKDSGRSDVVLIGHEMSDEVNKYLKEGVISAAICQNPFLQGYHALKQMAEFLVDKKLPVYEKMFINFMIYTKYNTYGEENYSG